MGQAEDDEDVKAAAIASEEAGAELAEFDENIPWDEREAELSKQQKESTSKVCTVQTESFFSSYDSDMMSALPSPTTMRIIVPGSF